MPVVPSVATDRYYVNHEIGDYLRIAEEAAPHLLRLYTIGTSYEGRPLFMAEITNHATGEGHEKPALWIDGGWRGGQLLGSSACLELVRKLTDHYGRDPVITDLLDHVTFYVCPRLAADAGDLSLHTGEWCWSSTRPVAPGLAGLRPGDANGDGRALQMRQQDPLGQWKVSRRDARLMVPRGPEDRQGPFYRLMPEGLCEGGGRATHGGVRSRLDLERNFPTMSDWDPQICGPYPLSEPETRVVADFFRSHANLGAVVSFGNLGSGIAMPEPSSADAPVITRLARKLQEWTGLAVNHTSAPGYLQWAHQNQGLLVVRAEPWNLARVVGVDRFDSERILDEPEQAGVIRWLDQNCPGAFYPWTAFDHPQLGPVDLGGWEWLYSWLNPPPGGLLQSELERFCKLVLGVAQSLPRLNVSEFVEETLGWADAHDGDDYPPLRKLRAVVENRGFLPTYVCRGSQRESQQHLELQLIMDHSASLLLGKERTHGHQLLGVGLNELETPVPYTAGDLVESRYEVEWLVQGSGRVQLDVRHPRAGVCHVSVSSDRATHASHEPAPAPHPPAYAAPLPPPPPPPSRPPARPAPPPMAAPPAPPPQPPQSPAAPQRPAAAPVRPPAPPPARPGVPQAPNRPAAIARPPAPAQPQAPPQQPPPQAPAAARTVPQPAPRSGLLGQPPGTAAALAAGNAPQPVPLAAPSAPPPAPAGGRVLGSPPPKAGNPVSAFAAHARELIQANQQRPTNSEPPPRQPGGDFEPFSPGLPMKSAFPSQPVESPASVDFDEMGLPPDPMDSRVLPPLLLRKREKGK